MGLLCDGYQKIETNMTNYKTDDQMVRVNSRFEFNIGHSKQNTPFENNPNLGISNWEYIQCLTMTLSENFVF